MITLNASNSNPYIVTEGVAIRKAVTQIKKRKVANVNDFCYCDCSYTYKENTFAGTLDYQKDYTSWLFQKVLAADTFVLQLVRNDIVVATIDDNTYGTYYSTFTTQPLYVGLVIDWTKVYNAFGGGEYKLKVSSNVLGVDETVESHIFILGWYDDIKADGTVKIETYNTGNILSSDFDYTNLIPNGWYQSVRINGMFGWKNPKIITDNYMNSNYKVLQIQDKVENEYILETELVPTFISDQLIYDNLLANKFLITDYNLFNEEIFRKIEVVVEEISDKKHFKKNKNAIFSIKFSDRKKNIIKSNLT